MRCKTFDKVSNQRDTETHRKAARWSGGLAHKQLVSKAIMQKVKHGSQIR